MGTNYLPVIPLTTPARVSGLPHHEVDWVRARNFKRKGMSINLLEWCVDDAKRHPILNRTVDKAVVEMVHLPDVFLQHPVVKVVESDNEMVISDFYTDEFIAKKIFFNDQQQQQSEPDPNEGANKQASEAN